MGGKVLFFFNFVFDHRYYRFKAYTLWLLGLDAYSFFNFIDVPYSMQDLSSPTRD